MNNFSNNESDKFIKKNMIYFIEPSDSNLQMSPLNLNSKNNSFLNSFKSLESVNFLKRNYSMKNLKNKKIDLTSKDDLLINNKFTFSHNVLNGKIENKEKDLYDNNLELMYFKDSDEENEEEEEKDLEILKILKNNNGIESNEIIEKNKINQKENEFYV